MTYEHDRTDEYETDNYLDYIWHNAEYAYTPAGETALKIDGEESGELSKFSFEHGHDHSDDNIDAGRLFEGGPETYSGGFTMRIEPNICQNCNWEIGPLEYEMVGHEEVQRTNYCAGCGKPVDEVLDL